jgi:hypothetical protein
MPINGPRSPAERVFYFFELRLRRGRQEAVKEEQDVADIRAAVVVSVGVEGLELWVIALEHPTEGECDVGDGKFTVTVDVAVWDGEGCGGGGRAVEAVSVVVGVDGDGDVFS